MQISVLRSKRFEQIELPAKLFRLFQKQNKSILLVTLNRTLTIVSVTKFLPPLNERIKADQDVRKTGFKQRILLSSLRWLTLMDRIVNSTSIEQSSF